MALHASPFTAITHDADLFFSHSVHEGHRDHGPQTLSETRCLLWWPNSVAQEVALVFADRHDPTRAVLTPVDLARGPYIRDLPRL
jgi:hypothetical protein